MAAATLKKRSLGQITGFLMIMSALSRVLGYVREIVMTTAFGQSWLTDAYKAAFLIPDFLYLVLIGGAFSTAFIPVLSGYVSNHKEEEAWRVASTIFNLLLIALFVTIGICYAGVPFIMDKFLAVGYAAKTKALAVYLTRIMLLQSFFMCLSGVCQGICHVYQQFTAPAVGSLLYNIAILAFGIAFMPTIGITGFAVGVVVGAYLNFLAQIPVLMQIGVHYQFVIDLHHKGVHDFFRLALPVVLGLSIIYLNNFVTQNLGSRLAEGTITALQNANRLMELPIGIFAIAIASAYFPTLTELVATGDMQGYKEKLVSGINLNNFIMIPASIGLACVSEPLIRALFMQGKFTEANVHLTAAVLVFYCIGIIGYSQQQILNRGFYAILDTKSAVAINCLIILVNIAFSLLLINILGARGLALAYSIAGLLSMALLFIVLRNKVHGLGGRIILASFLKILTASLVMGGCVTVFVRLAPLFLDISSKSAQLLEFFIAVGIGIVVYVLMAVILHIHEMDLALDLAKRKLHR